MRINLSSPASEISHIGKKVESQLKHLGILTVEDLLFYFPAKHDDLSKVTLIGDALLGQRIVVKAKIELLESKRSRYRKRLLTQALVSDNSGSLRVVWFNQPWIAKMFQPGDELYLVGEVKDDGSGLCLSSPIYEKVSRRDAIHTARLVPIYPSTEKLSQKQIRFLMRQSLPMAGEIVDRLPGDVKGKYGLMPLREAISAIHFPANEAELEKARYRLKFDELFRLQLFAVSLKKELKKIPAPSVSFHEKETKDFVGDLPFKLTDDQRKSAWEILKDMGKAKPMNRLLEGDVGSGKTIVVAIAALNCAMDKGQAAIMTPTEILARQHFATFSKLLPEMNIGLLTQGLIRLNNEEIKKSAMIKKISNSEVDIIIGTQAIIQEAVSFNNLVLAVIDEQHRFGVAQRKALKEKRSDHKMPHLLTLTATPIPRSLALVFYGDLDVSILREMPPGRKKIATLFVPGSWTREEAINFIRDQVKNNHQIFWTCPVIDPSDKLGVKAATEVFDYLKDEVFQDFNIGLLHGRMKSKKREETMKQFQDKEIDILVATSVIEVGIDIPNATVMVIEGAERFGLAQLHQFRGRVGRGEAQSYCLLFVGSNLKETANFRLNSFLQCHDGFELAERDLELRGPGDTYGTEQTGFPEFKIACFADVEIAKQAKQAAESLLDRDPLLQQHPFLKKSILAKEGGAHLE